MIFSTMRFADETYGSPFAKDPCVMRHNGSYWLYYSVVDADKRLRIGVASSHDLDNWQKVGELPLVGEAEKNGVGAPGGLVMDNKIHLFYQTYGNWKKDAICYATSNDGVHFERHPQNPIFHPTGGWNCGRAIDADVLSREDRIFLYIATRDPDMEIQLLSVATASLDSDFGRESWTQQGEDSILKPQLAWEGKCIEAPAVLHRGGKFWMFYGGAYNTTPQQIGLAVSDDGINWKRALDAPFLPNGAPGSWNSDESGHPFVFVEGERIHLFFQGTNDKGATWFLSRAEIEECDWPKLG